MVEFIEIFEILESRFRLNIDSLQVEADIIHCLQFVGGFDHPGENVLINLVVGVVVVELSCNTMNPFSIKIMMMLQSHV